MDLVGNLNFGHGVAIIARKQTNGVGRSNNQVKSARLILEGTRKLIKLKIIFQWLTPDGCAIFTLQLHIPLSTALGQRIPLLQQLVSVAVVKAVTNIPGYQVIIILLILTTRSQPIYRPSIMSDFLAIIKRLAIRDILWFFIIIYLFIMGEVDNLITLQFTIRINAFCTICTSIQRKIIE